MEIKVNLKVSAEDFYDLLMQNVAEDAQESTGKKTRVNQIKKGFTYEKKMSRSRKKTAKAKVKILECIPNKVYSAQFTNDINGVFTKYEIQEVSDDSIDVVYTEMFEWQKHGERKSFLREIYLQNKFKRRSKKLLKDIEYYILKAKD